MSFSFLHRKLVAVLVVVAAGVLFTSCSKNKDNQTVDIPAAGLMAFNLAPDQQSVAIRLSGSSLTASPLAFSNYTGVYQRIYTGERNVQSFDYPDVTALASANFNFEQDKYYSLFVVGAGDHYRNIVAVDNFDSLQAGNGKAYIRYINAIPDSINNPSVTVTASGTNVVNEAAPFTRVSEFTPVTPGELNVAVKNSTNIDTSRSITVQDGKAYTILLLGKPGATEEFKKVQIRFIENGTLTNDEGK